MNLKTFKVYLKSRKYDKEQFSNKKFKNKILLFITNQSFTDQK